MKARVIGGVLAALLFVASISAAQRGRFRFDTAEHRPAQYATMNDFDGGFQFCRLVFRQTGAGDGAGWDVDWDRADVNLSTRLAELTRTPVSMDGSLPKTLLVNPTMKEITHCPFIMMTEPGAAYFTPEDAANLRDYLLRGGFLWADDFWGDHAWEFFENQLRQVLPSKAYPIYDVPRDHPIFHQVLDASSVPQIPGIGYWDGANKTWERDPQHATAHIRAINDDHGRIMVLLTHDTDFGDSYERESEDPEYFMKFSVPGYAFGINVVVYAMTH
jgi:hypothetical protein